MGELIFKNKQAWRKWLEQNCTSSKGTFLVIYKKGFEVLGITYQEAVDEALCFGWIDSKTKSKDEKSFIQYFSPRKSNGPWTRANRAKAEKFIKQGLMSEFGLSKINEAKANGSWTMSDEIEDIIVPADLKDSLNKQKALANFENLAPSIKKQILWWIKSAKKLETRITRITKTVEAVTQNKSPLA